MDLNFLIFFAAAVGGTLTQKRPFKRKNALKTSFFETSISLTLKSPKRPRGSRLGVSLYREREAQIRLRSTSRTHVVECHGLFLSPVRVQAGGLTLLPQFASVDNLCKDARPLRGLGAAWSRRPYAHSLPLGASGRSLKFRV